MNTYRIFKGSETNQSRYDGTLAFADSWYYEPTDYDGDVLWSEAYESREAAEAAANAEAKEPEWEPRIESAEEQILKWCRSKPAGLGCPVMRERTLGQIALGKAKCAVLNADRIDFPVIFDWEGSTWDEVLTKMQERDAFGGAK